MKINKCYYCMEDLPEGQMICPHCGRRVGEKPQPEYALPRGSILHGQYLIGAVLGQGGFGITYIGYDLLLHLKVAIKEYYPMSMAGRSRSGQVMWSSHAMPKAEGCENFLKEARKMARLTNIPEVVRVLSIVQENNTAYIIMDFVEGTTLKNIIQQNGVMPASEAIALLTPVIRALDEVHQQGIIHRDISPDNIMINENGEARLLDLGAAKEVDMRSALDKQSSQLIHKDGFSPPEQYMSGDSIGPWTDVYAMCATIYYITTGKVLPAAMDRVMMKPQILFTENLSAAVRNVLIKGLDTDYTKRYQTMGKLLEALPQQERSTPKRGKLAIGIAAAVVVLAGVVLFLNKSAVVNPAVTVSPRITEEVTVETGEDEQAESSTAVTENTPELSTEPAITSAPTPASTATPTPTEAPTPTPEPTASPVPAPAPTAYIELGRSDRTAVKYFKDTETQFNIFNVGETRNCYRVTFKYNADSNAVGTREVYVQSKDAYDRMDDSGWIKVGEFKYDSTSNQPVTVDIDWSETVGPQDVYAMAAVIKRDEDHTVSYSASWGDRVILYYYTE